MRELEAIPVISGCYVLLFFDLVCVDMIHVNFPRSVLDELKRIGAPVRDAAEYAMTQCTAIDDSEWTGTPAEKLTQFLSTSIHPIIQS